MVLYIHLLIYYLVLSVLLYGSLAYNPRMWLHRMPPEVVSKVPAKTSAEKRLLRVVALPFFLLLVGYPIMYTLQQDPDWLSYFLILCAFFVGFDIWDTLILDVLIFCKLTPRFIILTGTKREDYSNTKYHLVSGVKGLLISFVASGVLATILMLVR